MEINKRPKQKKQMLVRSVTHANSAFIVEIVHNSHYRTRKIIIFKIHYIMFIYVRDWIVCCRSTDEHRLNELRGTLATASSIKVVITFNRRYPCFGQSGDFILSFPMIFIILKFKYC